MSQLKITITEPKPGEKALGAIALILPVSGDADDYRFEWECSDKNALTEKHSNKSKLTLALGQLVRVECSARRKDSNEKKPDYEGYACVQLLEDGFLEIFQLRESVPREASSAKEFGPIRAGLSPNEPKLCVPERVHVQLERSGSETTEKHDEILWNEIVRVSDDICFKRYEKFIDLVLSLSNAQEFASRAKPESLEYDFGDLNEAVKNNEISNRLKSRFSGVEPYRLLKAATEAFLMVECGGAKKKLTGYVIEDKLPYEILISQQLNQPLTNLDTGTENLVTAIKEHLRDRCFIELIWSYWHEEAMLAQAMNAISRRFQNRAGSGPRDPLAQLEIGYLRPVNNLLWGYIQAEVHRLPVVRRAAEYYHAYGMSLHGRAVGNLRPVDNRSKFLEAFHNLLYVCIQFYRQQDDTTVVADGFPVLNALKETHYVLAEGAHNQFGDLPTTARQEMLIEQWFLATPAMARFLGGRESVPYPERWMDRLDMVKTLYAWTDTSVIHFNDLAKFGEQILLSVRLTAWSITTDGKAGAAWALVFRNAVQGYVHAYRAVTGVDLADEPKDSLERQQRNLPPSVHLLRRLQAQTAE